MDSALTRRALKGADGAFLGIYRLPGAKQNPETTHIIPTCRHQPPTEVSSDSRLACQITMRNDLDGVVVRVPEVQH
jgi:hypothetical protein